MRIILLVVLPLALSACVTDRQITDYVCSHQIVETQAAKADLVLAEKIKDPTAKQLAIDAANARLDRVKACPTNLLP